MSKIYIIECWYTEPYEQSMHILDGYHTKKSEAMHHAQMEMVAEIKDHCRSVEIRIERASKHGTYDALLKIRDKLLKQKEKGGFNWEAMYGFNAYNVLEISPSKPFSPKNECISVEIPEHVGVIESLIDKVDAAMHKIEHEIDVAIRKYDDTYLRRTESE